MERELVRKFLPLARESARKAKRTLKARCKPTQEELQAIDDAAVTFLIERVRAITNPTFTAATLENCFSKFVLRQTGTKRRKADDRKTLSLYRSNGEPREIVDGRDSYSEIDIDELIDSLPHSATVRALMECEGKVSEVFEDEVARKRWYRQRVEVVERLRELGVIH